MVGDVIDRLFEPGALTPHGFCLLWEPGLIWTHALSDIAISAAYFSIPLTLAYFARRRPDLAFKPVFWLFSAFILLCGAGHVFELVTIWLPVYQAAALEKALTATVSLVTAIALWYLMPQALALPSPRQISAVNEALRESEARHRASYINTPLPLHTLDADGVITAVSDRWLTLLGYSRQQVIGNRIDWFEVPAAGSAPVDFKAEWSRVLQHGELLDVAKRFVRHDGTVLDVLSSARLEHAPDGTVRILGALVDVTARKQAEAALRGSEERIHQLQKMEAIGQLTGGLAHDFNNVLQAVTGSLELIRARLRSNPEIAGLATVGLDAAGKASRLTGQLLSFARRQQLEPQPLDPIEVAEGMRSLLTRTAGTRIALRVISTTQARTCLADRSQLESALLNLTINARDAIGDAPGTITVSVSSERVGRRENAAGEQWPPVGDYVRIAVVDDGPGMPDSVRLRAFEPFFTTKPVGHGSGLGLSQIDGFAHQSGGTAYIESTPGQGTVVAILLPRTAVPATSPWLPQAATPATEDDAPHGNGETVLLVDDDEMVRTTLAATLRDLDYAVVEAANADEGLDCICSGVNIDAMITDLTMPGPMDGIALAAAVRHRCPDLPILLATGHLEPLRSARLPTGVGLIQKPYSRFSVASALMRRLRAAAPAVAEVVPVS